MAQSQPFLVNIGCTVASPSGSVWDFPTDCGRLFSMAKIKGTRSGSTISKRSAVKASHKSAKSVAASTLTQKSAGGFVLGRKAFTSISAVEGVYLSRDMKADFRRLEGVSPAARRDALSGKYGKK